MKSLKIAALFAICLSCTPSVFSQKVEINLNDYSITNDVLKSNDTIYVVEVLNVQPMPPMYNATDTTVLSQNLCNFKLKITSYQTADWRTARKKIDIQDPQLKELQERQKQLADEIKKRQEKMAKLKADKN